MQLVRLVWKWFPGAMSSQHATTRYANEFASLFSIFLCFCKSCFIKSSIFSTRTLWKLFFVNQLRNASTLHPGLVENTIELSAKGDFIVKSEYTFEIGGKGKGFNQISRVEKSFVVADDIETGFQNKIPLWLFGFLY